MRVQCGGLLELGVDDFRQDGQLARDLQHGAAVANSIAVVARGEHGDELPARKVLVAASDARYPKPYRSVRWIALRGRCRACPRKTLDVCVTRAVVSNSQAALTLTRTEMD